MIYHTFFFSIIVSYIRYDLIRHLYILLDFSYMCNSYGNGNLYAFIGEYLCNFNTRRCLKLIDKYGFGIAMQTKSNRIHIMREE